MNFSVLMSLYYKENHIYLREALESITTLQSLKPNEIVIVKDGLLNEELNNLLIEFKKKTEILKIVGYKENKGLGYALNYGLKYCSNEIIFRMDSDDVARKNRFKVQIDAFISNPEISIIGCKTMEFNYKPHDLNRYREVPYTSEEIEKKKLIRNPFNHMTVGFKKSDVIKAGGYKEMAGYEDYYLWLRLLKFKKGLNLESVLVDVRIGNGMINKRQGLKFFLYEISFQKQILKEMLQSKSQYIFNCIFRALPRLLPKFLLNIIYKFLLRK